MSRKNRKRTLPGGPMLSNGRPALRDALATVAGAPADFIALEVMERVVPTETLEEREARLAREERQRPEGAP